MNLYHIQMTQKKQFDVNEDDLIKEKYLKFLIVSLQIIRQRDINKIFKEGEERYNSKTPPGYMDSKKKDFMYIMIKVWESSRPFAMERNN